MSSSLFAAIAVVGVGSLIVWSNSRHLVNRMVFTCSIHIALWLACMHLTITSPSEGLFWLRWTTAIAAIIPLHFWLVKEAIASDFKDLVSWRSARVWWWLIVPFGLAGLCFTTYFIPDGSTDKRRLFGPGYYIFILGSLGLYVALAFDSFRKIRVLTGGRRLALQVWLWGGCAAATTILVLMMLNVVIQTGVRLQPFVVLLYYAGTAIAITTHRIFDARQLMLIGLGKFLLVVVVGSVAYVFNDLAQPFLPQGIAFFATVALSIWLARIVRRRLDSFLQFFPEATAARQAAFAAAQRESRIEALEAAFRTVLKGWGQSEHSVIISGTKDLLIGSGIEIAGDGTVANAMRQLRWVTPERLARERSTPERLALSNFLSEHDLGILLVIEGPALTLLAGVGYGASRRPFTYPQATQLMELASIMENALERAHFSAKVQHAEQLATVGLLGASLAHEIRNPLVSIKTFVQLLPTHYQDPVFREKFFRLIGDEVGRIDQLTEQLLDLASPRVYAAEVIELHPLLRASLDLVAAKAGHRCVQLLTDFEASPDRAYTDASAAKQVMLNLCFNAIQAVENHSGEDKWVRIATRNTDQGIEMAVADSGPGISDEIRPRLFQPFQTTKSTGFGLGLAICSDILINLNASISVDPSEPGRGATFRVTFPCQPLSS